MTLAGEHEGTPGSAGGAPGLVSSATSDTPDACQALVAELDRERRRFGRMRRVILTAGRLMADTWKGRCDWLFVTLTYRPGAEMRAGDVSMFVKRMREWLRRRQLPCRYVWSLEEQAGTGQPHYHVMVQVPKGFSLPFADEIGWWTHGSTNTQRARRAVGYLAKYASKAGRILKWRGARAYGVSGLQANQRAVLSFWRAPRWVRAAFGFCDQAGTLPETGVVDAVRRVRGGFAYDGEVVRSPVVPKFIRGVLVFLPRPAEVL